MKLDELHQEISKDFPINKTALADEALKTTSLWCKYIKYWSDEKLRLEKMESGLSTLFSIKREYYSGNASPEVYQQKPFNGRTPKSDRGIQILMEADLDVIAYQEGLIVQKNKVEVLEACLAECKSRGYAIANAISMVKFENGG